MNTTTAKIIADNAECVKILTSQGLLNAFNPKPGKDTACTSFEHEGHWCLASYHFGQTNAEENGYVILMLPMSDVTRDEARQFFAETIVEMAGAKLSSVEITEIPSVSQS
jgi:hypothetical protein